MSSNKSTTTGISFGVLILLIFIGFAVLIGIIQTPGGQNLGYSNVNNNPYSHFYLNEDGELLYYSGNQEDLVLPNKYSISNTYETRRVSFNNFYQIETFRRAMELDSFRVFRSMEETTNSWGGIIYQEIWDVEFRFRPAIEGDEFNLITIGENAFSNNKNIKNIELPVGLETIEAYAFLGSNLVNISLNNGLKYIGHQAFANTKIQEFIMPDSVEDIGFGLFENCYQLEYVYLSSSLTSIPQHTFWFNENLVQVDMPNSIRSIGSRAFYYCISLNTINLPSSLESINNQAFYYCINLESLTLPSNTVMISSEAFAMCNSLEELIIEAFNPPNISGSVFPSHTTIYVPDQSYEVYTSSSSWSIYEIKMISEI